MKEFKAVLVLTFRNEGVSEEDVEKQLRESVEKMPSLLTHVEVEELRVRPLEDDERPPCFLEN